MPDWKQITARIRRARTSKDPAAQLTTLFEKTHDAMVAFELAKYLETIANTADAARWYATAAERFRRADWKTKAQEAVTRLGGAIPFPIEPQSATGELTRTPSAVPAAESALPFPSEPESAEPIAADGNDSPANASPASTSAPADARGRRRRGRRGGRNRRRTTGSTTPGAGRPAPDQSADALDQNPASTEPSPPGARPRRPDSRSIPALPVEAIGEPVGPAPKGRYGDPGLSSRLTQLEMHFRRLLNCPPAKLEDADRAPAGPGVFVLTDEDLTSYYYVEACDTLRVAIGHLARGSGGRRGNPALKPQLADHLGIPESRVAKYLSDHCVVRWLQLDEGAPYFAHFAIAVLRPILND